MLIPSPIPPFYHLFFLKSSKLISVMGTGEQGMGNGEWGMGNEEWGMRKNILSPVPGP
jgi:hypothetical protein